MGKYTIMCTSFILTEMPKFVINELFLFNSYKSVRLSVDDPVVLNIVIASMFILLLYFPSKIKKETIFLNRPFTDSLRGIAMFLIVMHHLSRSIVNPTDLIFYFDLGFIGVGCYLFLSGYGLMESYRKNGLSDTFLKDRFSRIFIPVVLINSFIQLLNISSNEDIGLLKRVATIVGIINLNWFIGFIVFWYLIYYIIFKIKISDSIRIISLFAVSFVLLTSESIDATARINALSFPCGVLISQYRSIIQNLYENNKEKSYKMVCFIFSLTSLILLLFFVGLFIKDTALDQLNPYPSSIFIMQKPLSYFVLRLVLIGVCSLIVMTTLITKRKKISKKLIVNLAFFSFFVVIATPWLPRDLLQYFITNSLAIVAIVFITILLKVIIKNRSSVFFMLWGRMSLELLIMQGLLINAYVFILFKLPIQYSIIIFITFLSMISYLFFKMSEFFRKKILKIH